MNGKFTTIRVSEEERNMVRVMAMVSRKTMQVVLGEMVRSTFEKFKEDNKGKMPY